MVTINTGVRPSEFAERFNSNGVGLRPTGDVHWLRSTGDVRSRYERFRPCEMLLHGSATADPGIAVQVPVASYSSAGVSPFSYAPSILRLIDDST